MTATTPLRTQTDEEWDALMKRSPSLSELVRRSSAELARNFAGDPRTPYPEGNWDDIALDIPLSQRGFGS